MSWLKMRDRAAYLRLTGVLFLVFAAAGTVAPLFANYVTALGADTGQLGLLLATYQIAALASQYWWGRLSDRLGRRKPLVALGTAGLGLCHMLAASAGWFGWLFPVRIIEGLAFAAYSTGALALIGDVLEDERSRGRLMGTYRMFGSLAFAIAAFSGGQLADTFGLRAPLIMSAVFYGLGFLLVMGVRERVRTADDRPTTNDDRPTTTDHQHEPPARDTTREPQDARPETRSEQPGASSTLARRAVVPFLALAFAWFFGMGSVVSLWPVYMSGAGHSQTTISSLWAQAALGEVVGLMLAGYLADRFSRKWVIIFGVAGMACVYIAYTISTDLAWLIPVQVLRSLSYSCFEAPALLYATELGLRQRRGRMAGLYNTVTGVGGVVGAVAGGAAATQVGLPVMFRGAAVIMLCVVFVVALVMPRLRAGVEESEPAPRPA
jgi:MFS family permease